MPAQQVDLSYWHHVRRSDLVRLRMAIRRGAIRRGPAGWHRGDTPRGTPAGGCWAIIKSKDDELYAPPKHVKLLALQSAWDTIIFGTAPLIGGWVHVIVRYYPDLRDIH